MRARLPSHHPLIELRGTPRACGQQYGEHYAEAITAFYLLEIEPHLNPKRLRFGARCWEIFRHWETPVVDFARGMARGAGFTPEEVTLLLLHEEFVHLPHCTSLGATGQGTPDGAPILGQTWDWNSRLYLWSHLTRLHAHGMPRALLYSYPGLWAGAGINEHGLSLVWTSSGPTPKAPPRAGIPTYAIIAALLARRTCREALALLRATKNAGSFIFTIADAAKEVWVIEGMPHRIEAIPCEDVVSRANHYEGAAAKARTGQTPSQLKTSTRFRGPRMARLVRRFRGTLDARRVEACLRDRFGGRGKSICQGGFGKQRTQTLDAFYCLPLQREFWIARGLPTRHAFRQYTPTP